MMFLKCPHCLARQKILRLRKKFSCHNCGKVIGSNVTSLEIPAIVVAAIGSALFVPSGLSFWAGLALYNLVGILTIAVFLTFVRLEIIAPSADKARESERTRVD